jgi:hypothetical protein
MKRLVIMTILAILLTFPPQGRTAAPFRFAVFSDSRSDVITEKCSDANTGVSPVLALVVNDILDRHQSNPINLVIFPGDMIAGYLQRDQKSVAECNRLQLIHWRNTMKPLLDAGIQIRVTAGNHDLATLTKPQLESYCSPHNRPYIPSLDNVNVLKEVLGDMFLGNPGPASDMGLTYSFDAGGCHFSLLTAYTMFENSSFSNETLRWLENDLKQASEKNLHIIVAAHPPAFPGGGHMWDSLPFFDPEYSCEYYSGIDSRKDRDRFWNLLKKFGAVAYLCGHEHNIQVQCVEGVWQIVSAGLTPVLYELNGSDKDKKRNTILYDGQFQNPRAKINWPWDESKRAYWGWCLVTVNGPNMSLEVFGSDSLPTKKSDLNLLKSFFLLQGAPTP